MQKLTVKEHHNTWEYELYDSSDAPGEEYLKIIRYNKGNYADEESVDLWEISPEYCEISPDTQSSKMVMILANCGGIFFFLIFLAAFLIQFFEQKLLVPIHTVLSCIPLAVAGICWNFARKNRKTDTASKFIFEDGEYTRITIPYSDKRRSEILQFVQRIAACCNQELLWQQQQPVIRYQFANGLAELRDYEIVVFNQDGGKVGSIDYAWCEPGTEMQHHVEKHWIKNFFCILFAALSWFVPLAMIINIVGCFMDIAMAVSFGMIYIIPFGLGCYFLSKYQKSQNYYFASGRFQEDDEWYICLAVDKNPGSEKAFIDELNRRLRNADHGDPQVSETSPKIVIQQPSETSLKAGCGAITLLFRWLLGISIAVEGIIVFFVFTLKPADAVLIWFIVAVVLCLIFEHLNNWLIRRKKGKKEL